MKKIIAFVLLFPMLTGCAYESAYSSYALSQSMIAQATAPIVTFHSNGQLASVGNPMTPLIGMQMKGPKSDWDGFWDVLRMAVPFAAIGWAVNSMANVNHGNTSNTTVGGANNLVGNTSSGGSILSSPPTTTTTTTSGMGVELKLPDGLIAEGR